jgi:hypothetical protein
VHWGELEYEEEEEEEEDEEEEDEEGEEGEADATGLETPMTDKTGLSSVVSGLETPEGAGMDLRKKAGLETPMEGPRELYKKLEQTEAGGAGASGFFAGEKRYAGLSGASGSGSSRDVQIALNPDELVDSLRDENALKVRGLAWPGLVVLHALLFVCMCACLVSRANGRANLDPARPSFSPLGLQPQERYEQELEARQTARRLDDSDDEDDARGGKKRKADKGGGGRSSKKSKEFKF